MATVVSINVGLPRDVEWQGKIVHTAIWKQPVQGRVMARHLNIDGDGQGDLGGHGGENRAVMVYQVDSYKHWEQHLAREHIDYGELGENLTVDGLADDEVCIGDRYQIGGAVFEVTQPRVTCYRVGLRMNNPQMPSLLVAHKRPGFYLRVIQEGEIGAGDEIVKVLEGQGRLTVAETDGLLYLPGHPRERLELALHIPALSAGWKSSFAALMAAESQGGNAGLAAVTTPLLWTGYRALRVASVARESADVLSFVFEAQDGVPLPAPLPGQFLAMKLRPDASAAPVLRSYSISGPQSAGTYRISVKRSLGPGSQYLHDHLHAGDLLEVSAPRGSFTLVANQKPVVLLSAGIGVTPVLSMLHALAAKEQPAAREVWWCYGARNGHEHPFAEEVRGLLQHLPASHSLVVYSQPGSADALGRDYDARGHVNIALLEQQGVPKAAEFYLCGPDRYLDEMTEALQQWGVTASQIHSEIFGAGASMTPGIASTQVVPPHQPKGEMGAGPGITFTRSGITVPWNPRYGSLLEFAEACDVPVRWSCRVGVCHNCESGLIGGKVRYAPEPLDPPAEGNVLICCSTPLSEVELDL